MSTPVPKLSCRCEKIVLAMGSGSGGCPCTCNYLTDASCQCRDLADTINITVTKGPVFATYPLTYQQAYNWKPTEVMEIVLVDT